MTSSREPLKTHNRLLTSIKQSRHSLIQVNYDLILSEIQLQ